MGPVVVLAVLVSVVGVGVIWLANVARRRVARWFTSGLVGVTAAMLMLVTVIGARGGGPLVVALALIVALIVGLFMQLTMVEDRDIWWLAQRVTMPDGAAHVYRRYLRRHRAHRLVGGWTGAMVAAIVGITWYGSVTAGTGAPSPLGDVVFVTLAGVQLGILSAEGFQLSRPQLAVTGVASASVADRSVTNPERALLAAARLVFTVALVLVLVWEVTGHGKMGTVMAVLVGGISLATTEMIFRAIRLRPRPALSPMAAEVDGNIRRFGRSTTSRLGLAIALLSLAWVVGTMPSPGVVPGIAAAVVAWVALVTSAVLVWRARPRPPRGWAPPSDVARPAEHPVPTVGLGP